LRPNIAEPQSPQNHFSPPLSGFQTRSLSSPATILNAPGAGWAFAEAPVPPATLAALAMAVAGDGERLGHLVANDTAVAAAREWEGIHRLKCVGAAR
jgi:hypothetical protein